MSRSLPFLLLAAILFLPRLVPADDDQGPAISITSPDRGTTFAFGTIRDHSLVWNKKDQMLMVYVTFTDAELNSGQPNDDTHEFKLPGITFDEAKGIFFAKSDQGESIPVARVRKALFFKTIETTPNAVVRVQHPRGRITVILEAISPNDPAMHAPPDDSNPDGTHKLNPDQMVN